MCLRVQDAKQLPGAGVRRANLLIWLICQVINSANSQPPVLTPGFLHFRPSRTFESIGSFNRQAIRWTKSPFLIPAFRPDPVIPDIKPRRGDRP